MSSCWSETIGKVVQANPTLHVVAGNDEHTLQLQITPLKSHEQHVTKHKIHQPYLLEQF